MKKELIIIALVFISCSQQKAVDTTVLKNEIIQADIKMSGLAAKAGFNHSLLAFADSSFVKLSDGNQPIIGKAAFASSFNQDKDVKTISWTPANAEVAKSGELGYTWGNWKFVTPDTTFYGNYFTIWKKQADGSWKIGLDGGNGTPAPAN
ncbi:MAG: DUF4440 domain-containing protein [Ferruginibacter sp.]